ncbi:hypothetical protein C6501_08740 [Candidatus Poribacteria bacterium]|nr:MAG: hypothetical protein C6501_08740 [Candidatus Poribacteria bacterium]
MHWKIEIGCMESASSIISFLLCVVKRFMSIGCVNILAKVWAKVRYLRHLPFFLSESRITRRTRRGGWQDKFLFKRFRQTLNRRLGVPNLIIREIRDSDTHAKNFTLELKIVGYKSA